jgi:hypothetical protein
MCNTGTTITHHRACPRDLLFVGATWLRLNAFAARATSVASLITSSKPRSVRCTFLGRISAQIRSLSSSTALPIARAAPAHREAIESRIEPRSAFPASSQRRTSAATSKLLNVSRNPVRSLPKALQSVGRILDIDHHVLELALPLGNLGHKLGLTQFGFV